MKRILVVLTVIGALFLTGCSKMDMAASVGDTEISLTDLQSRVDSILAERKKIDTSQMDLEFGEALTRSQLSFLISTLIIEAVGEDRGIKITDADIESYKSQVLQSIGGESALPNVLVNATIAPESLNQVLRRDLIVQAIRKSATDTGADDQQISDLIQGLVTAKADKLKVVVNPRYGKWDNATFGVVAAETAGDAVTQK